MEKDEVLAGDDVRDAVSVVGHRPEPATGRDGVRMLVQVQPGRLSVRRLRRRQAPRLAQHLLQERRVDFEVFGNDVEAEQVTIDPFAAHGVLVAALMLGTGGPQQPNPLLALCWFVQFVEVKNRGEPQVIPRPVIVWRKAHFDPRRRRIIRVTQVKERRKTIMNRLESKYESKTRAD